MDAARNRGLLLAAAGVALLLAATFAAYRLPLRRWAGCAADGIFRASRHRDLQDLVGNGVRILGSPRPHSCATPSSILLGVGIRS
jgi:hypothetical protein